MVEYGVPLLKKILILLSCSIIVLFAESFNIEKKIYTHIIHALYPQKATLVKVWTDNPSKLKVLQSIPRLKIVKKPQEADFLVVHKEKNLQSKGLIFTTDYHTLEVYKERAIGGFYWQKGRPNILFLRQNLKKYHIKLPEDMQEYVEDSL